MSYPVMPLGFLGSQGGDNDTYRIERSLRFNSADSAYLSRTPSSAGNRTTWTLSFWIKKCSTNLSFESIFNSTPAGSGDTIRFDGNNKITFVTTIAGGNFTSDAVFRDTSSWYHFVVTLNTNNTTQADRLIFYVNGTRLTGSSITISSGSQGSINNNASHEIGVGNSSLYYLNSYLAEINFIDGQALTPSSFGETDALTGRWRAKAYSGTYGTNGFYLKFADNSGTTATTLGKDSSGNGNNWTPNNFSVTAGAGNDSLLDSPTNSGTSGNYCTLNPISTQGSYTAMTDGNLSVTLPTSSSRGAVGAIFINSGKWYFEMTAIGSAAGDGVGIISDAGSFSGGAVSQGVIYFSSGIRNLDGSNLSYGASYTTNDIIGVAINNDSGGVEFYKNGVSQGNISIAIRNYAPAVSAASSIASGPFVFNFGQRPFAYTAPSGFKALCTTNLPTPTIKKPSSYMDVVTYTGNGSTQTISSLGFSPDLVWVKGRSVATNNVLFDTVRGANREIQANNTSSETTRTDALTSFNSNGFSLGADAGTNVNYSGATFVAWAWDAGEASSTNTAGSITSTVRVNALAGISVVGYTGNGTASTVGHGLGKTPSLIIVKCRNQSVATNWVVWSNSFSSLTNNYLLLNGISAVGTISNYWGTSAPTSSVFSVAGGGYDNNHSGFTHIAYLFAEVEGFSKFGSYTGNGSADGPFVWCGFRPRFLFTKRTDSGVTNWQLVDSARFQTNECGGPLYPNLSNSEAGSSNVDLLSNGFKARANNGDLNASGGTYIFAAFAESPFKYARAR